MAGNSKRFGFLLYLTEEDAASAVKNMNGHRIHNKPVTLNFARDRNHSENVASIYAGNLSYKTDKDALQGAFNNAVDAHIAVDGIKPKGFGYVDFMSHDDAEAALQETITLDGRVLKLQWPARDKKKHGNHGLLPMLVERELTKRLLMRILYVCLIHQYTSGCTRSHLQYIHITVLTMNHKYE